LILNAGLAGNAGNSHVVALHAASWLAQRAIGHELVVLRDADPAEVGRAIARAERLVFVSGTYWGGFSSLLQRLFEELTPTEGTAHWLAKPAAVFVTAHQVGGQGVLWRLQGVASMLGCLLPPMTGVVITKVAEQLRARAPELCSDVWSLGDVEVALHNLMATPPSVGRFAAWPVDRAHYADRWLEGAH
jgi:chromate reductase